MNRNYDHQHRHGDSEGAVTSASSQSNHAGVASREHGTPCCEAAPEALHDGCVFGVRGSETFSEMGKNKGQAVSHKEPTKRRQWTTEEIDQDEDYSYSRRRKIADSSKAKPTATRCRMGRNERETESELGATE